MDLAEAGACVGRDHRLGARDRFLRWQPLPRIRSEMVAAQDDPRRIEADPGCDRLDKTAEVRRRHAGVAPFLVNLVAGGLNKHAPRRSGAVHQGRLDDHRMRAADRRDAGHAFGQTLAHQRGQSSTSHEWSP
jgi:hypothetical protein